MTRAMGATFLLHTSRLDGFVLMWSDSDCARIASRFREHGPAVYEVDGVGTVLNSGHASAKSLPIHAAATTHNVQPKARHCCAVPDPRTVTRPCGDSADPTVRSAEQQERAAIR